MRDAFFRVEGIAQAIRTPVGLERARGVGVDGQLLSQVVDQPETRGNCVVRLFPAAGGGELVFIALLEAFQTRADLLDRLRPLSSWLLYGAVAAYALLFWSSRGFTAAVRPSSWGHALLQAYAGCWMTLWCRLRCPATP